MIINTPNGPLSVSLVLDDSEVQAFAEAYAGQATIDQFLDRVGDIIRQDIRENFEQGVGPDGAATAPLAHPRQSGGAMPLVGRGSLMAAATDRGAQFHHEVRGNNVLEFGISEGMPYARKQLAGGTTIPTHAKNLTIPLTAAAEAVKPRQFPSPLRVKFGRKGPIGLADESGDLQYLFVDQVTNPPRPKIGWGAKLIAKVKDFYMLVFGERALVRNPKGQFRAHR